MVFGKMHLKFKVIEKNALLTDRIIGVCEMVSTQYNAHTIR